MGLPADLDRGGARILRAGVLRDDDEPQGPVYMCYDALLQELPLEDVPLPPADAVRTPAPLMPDPGALREIADRLLAAENPVLMAEYVGRRKGGFESMVELAETVGAPVWDIPSALNFPNRHPLSLSMDKDVFRKADLVVGLDVRDWEKPTHELNSTMRTLECLVPESADWVEIGFGEINMSKWSFDYGRWQPCSVRAIGDTALGRSSRGSAANGSAPTRGLPRASRIAGAPSRGATRRCGRVAGGRVRTGILAADAAASGQRGMGGHQGRRLGLERQHAQDLGPKLGLRQAASTSGQRYRHVDPNRDLAASRSRTRAQGRLVVDSSPTAI